MKPSIGSKKLVLAVFKNLFKRNKSSSSVLELPSLKMFLICSYFGRSTIVGQRPLKSLSSVCLPVQPSLTFLEIGSLVFHDNVHNDV